MGSKFSAFFSLMNLPLKKSHYSCAIITAAGSGTRMGGVSKQLIPVNAKPLICYSLEAFEKSDYVKEIYISARKEELPEMERIVKEGGFSKVKKVIEGGATRFESIKNAFSNIPRECDFVAIHDAARPLITTQDIDEVFRAAYRTGAAAAAHKVADTLKRADKDMCICADIERSDAWALQTPQIFMCDIYRVGIAHAKKNNLSAVTDDTSIVSAAGFKVTLIETGAENFKVTTPNDLELFKKLAGAE